MSQEDRLHPTFVNPFLIKPKRPLPDETAVIGAGPTGPDIAYYLRGALPDKKLYLVDIAEEPLRNAEKLFHGYAQEAVAGKKLKEDQAQALLKKGVYTTDYGQMGHCGLAIEAATENLDLKQKIFEKVEGLVGEIACTDAAREGITAFLEKGEPVTLETA